MDILIITPYFYPENFRINDLAVYLANNNHDISVLAPIPNYPEGKFFKGYGIKTKRKESWKKVKIYRSILIPRGSGSNLRLAISWISSIFGNLLTSHFIMKRKFDLIFVYGPSPFTICLPAIYIKKLKKIPICFWVLDLWPESVQSAGNLNTSIIPKFLLPFVKFTYNNCDKILVSSPGFIQSIKGKNIKSKKIDFFPQWAEPIFKKIDYPKNSLSMLPKGSFVVMFAGNIGEAQGFPAILEAAKILKNNKKIQWVIIGSGRKEKWVKDKINELGLDDVFHMIGRLPLSDMPNYYAQASAMLISLKKEHIFSITIPAKLQSYLACAKPILAMIDGSTSNIVNNYKAGLTCNSEDANKLSKNILSMSEMSNSDIDQFGQNAYNLYLEKFERNKLFLKLEDIFSQLINKKV